MRTSLGSASPRRTDAPVLPCSLRFTPCSSNTIFQASKSATWCRTATVAMSNPPLESSNLKSSYLISKGRSSTFFGGTGAPSTSVADLAPAVPNTDGQDSDDRCREAHVGQHPYLVDGEGEADDGGG